jgi:hypothetical protein
MKRPRVIRRKLSTEVLRRSADVGSPPVHEEITAEDDPEPIVLTKGTLSAFHSSSTSGQRISTDPPYVSDLAV